MICSHCKQEGPRYHIKSGRCKECHSLKNKENRLKKSNKETAI